MSLPDHILADLERDAASRVTPFVALLRELAAVPDPDHVAAEDVSPGAVRDRLRRLEAIVVLLAARSGFGPLADELAAEQPAESAGDA